MERRLVVFGAVLMMVFSSVIVSQPVESYDQMYGELNPDVLLIIDGYESSTSVGMAGTYDRDETYLAISSDTGGGTVQFEVIWSNISDQSMFPSYLITYSFFNSKGDFGIDNNDYYIYRPSWVSRSLGNVSRFNNSDGIRTEITHVDVDDLETDTTFGTHLRLRYCVVSGVDDFIVYIDQTFLDISSYKLRMDVWNLNEQLNQTQAELNDLKMYGDRDTRGYYNNEPYVYPRLTGSYEGTRGRTADPYLTMIYTANNTETRAESVSLWQPYKSVWSDTQILSDRVDLSFSSSFTMFWINDTDSNNITDLYSLGQTEPLNHFNAEGQNMTVDVSGGTVRADRYSRVKYVDEFTWNYDYWTRVWRVRSAITNDLGMDWMDLFFYWGFPTEDDDGRPIWVDLTSIIVKDTITNTILDAGKNYDLSESGLSFGLETILNSQTREFLIMFTEKPLVSDTTYRAVYDYDISSSSEYPNSPWFTGMVITQPDTTSFNGELIVGFVFTQRFSGRMISKLDVLIFVNGQQRPFSYDSRSNEIHVYDLTLDAGSQNDVAIYFDFYTAETSFQEFFMSFGIGMAFLGIILIALGLGYITDQSKKKNKFTEMSWVKRVLLIALIIAGLILLIMSGLYPLVMM